MMTKQEVIQMPPRTQPMTALEYLADKAKRDRDYYVREYLDARRRGLVIMRRHYRETALRHSANLRRYLLRMEVV